MMDDLATALLDRDNLRLRGLVQDLLFRQPDVASWPQPTSFDLRIRAAAASLAELCAERQGQMPPTWTAGVGKLDEPMFVVRSAATMKRLRYLCETESPLPLRKRGFYAPPDFLDFA